MQILRQALFEKLNTQIITFKVLRNKIICLTEFQLILLSIDSVCRKVQIPYSGPNVRTIEMSKDYIAILERSGHLQIRRLENIKQVVYTQNDIKIANSKYPKLKWWQDDLHLIYQKRFEQIKIPTQQRKSNVLPFQISPQQNLIQLEFCDLFQGFKSIFYVLKNSISLCLQGLKLGCINFEHQEIRQVLRLCHPFQQNEFHKQYLAIVAESKLSLKKTYLKVYNVFTMELIYEKQLYKQKDQRIQILSDQLCEYLLVKNYKISTKNQSETIEYQSLLKVNGQYFYSSEVKSVDENQSFFLFDIEIGLKKDLKLFPSHSENINGKLCNSIDTCYFEKNSVFIASVVLEASYKDETYKGYRKQKGQNQLENPKSDIFLWKEIVQAKVNPKEFIEQIIKNANIRNQSKKQKQLSLEIGLEHEYVIQSFLDNLNKFNPLNSQINLSSAYQVLKKVLAIEYFPILTEVMSIERNDNRTARQILEKSNEDFTNTRSGFSSSQQHSPRSVRSSNTNKTAADKDKYLLKDISSRDLSRQDFIIQEEGECPECKFIPDHENLELMVDILHEASQKTDQTLRNIETSLFRLQNSRYRLQKMEDKVKKEVRQEKNVKQIIQAQFKDCLDQIKFNTISSAKRFTERLKKRTGFILQKQDIKSEFIQKLEDRNLSLETQTSLNKRNHDDLLDCLYDIEFPQVGAEYQTGFKTSPGLKPISFEKRQTNTRKKGKFELPMPDTRNQQFKLFKELFYQNFV